MMGGSSTHFDFDIIKAFLAAFSPFPVGQQVILSDGRIGTVLSNTTNVLRPVIFVKNDDGTDEMIDLYNAFRYLTLSIKALDKSKIKLVEAD